jgi:hypothetical protein
MFVPPCVIRYASDPRGMMAGLVQAHEEELAAIVPGPHNAGRGAELARALERYRRQLAAAAEEPAAPQSPVR